MNESTKQSRRISTYSCLFGTSDLVCNKNNLGAFNVYVFLTDDLI